MKTSALLTIALVLSGCVDERRTAQDLVQVHDSADAMERSESFLAQITVDVRHPLTREVVSTISGAVDLTEAEATFEASSGDGDSWSEIVVGETAYHSRGEVVGAPDWCAVPVAKVDGNVRVLTGLLFQKLPDLLRSAREASPKPEASTANSTAYGVTFAPEDTGSGPQLEGDRATLWLDEEGRPVRAEFAFVQPVAGSDDPAVGHVAWVLSDWGAKVDATAPPVSEIEGFPECSF